MGKHKGLSCSKVFLAFRIDGIGSNTQVWFQNVLFEDDVSIG